jgi:hypothetical protein
VGKVRPVPRADSFAVLVVPNVKVRMEAQHFVFSLSFHDFLQKGFTFFCHSSSSAFPKNFADNVDCTYGYHHAFPVATLSPLCVHN